VGHSPRGQDCCKRLVGAFQEVLLEVVKLGRLRKREIQERRQRKGSDFEGGALPESDIIGRRNGRRRRLGFVRCFA